MREQSVMTTHTNAISTLMQPWYAITAPAPVPDTAPLWNREIIRRARVISLVTIVAIVLTALPLAFHPSIQLFDVLLGVIALDMFALTVFNRRGAILISGLIITAITEIGIMGELIEQISLHQELYLGIVPLLCLLIHGVAIAASTLNVRVAFFIFILNCAFLFIVVTYIPYSPDLKAYILSPEGYEGLIQTPLSCLIVGFCLIAIWVNSANKAIRQADIADERAIYINKLAEQDHQAALQKVQLERDIEELVMGIASMANTPGKPLVVKQNNTLWSINIALDHLRMRLNNLGSELLKHRAMEQRTQAAATQLATYLRTEQSLRSWEPTGTVIDLLASSAFLLQEQTKASNVSSSSATNWFLNPQTRPSSNKNQ